MNAENWEFRYFYPLKVYPEGDENAKINNFLSQVPLPIHVLALFEAASRCDGTSYYKKQIMWPFSVPLLPLREIGSKQVPIQLFSLLTNEGLSMQERIEIIPVILQNGSEVMVEVTVLGGEEQVGLRENITFDSITKHIEAMADQLLMAVKAVKPTKATIEFGVEFGLESGQITSFLVKGTGNANVKITLEWEDQAKK